MVHLRGADGRAQREWRADLRQDSIVKRVCHLSSVHRHDDVRIYLKECRTLVAAGYETHFVVPGAPDEVRDGVHLHGVDLNHSSRITRMTHVASAVYRAARTLRADIYHLHDPELLPVGLLLRAEGHHAIFDAHEHVVEDILHKEWIPPVLRRPVAGAYGLFESFAVKRLSAVAAATPHIGAYYQRSARRVAVVNNYPFREELGNTAPAWSNKEPCVCYVGLGSRARGVLEMLEAVHRADVKLLLAGSLDDSVRNDAMAHPGWRNTQFVGQVSRTEVADILRRSMVGIVLFHPLPNHVHAQPNKLFEYMSAGIPVVASAFPLWRRLVEGHGCGICVDPSDVDDTARAIRRLVHDPQLAQEMGRRGHAAVEKDHSWEHSAQSLLSLYRELS